MVKEIVVVTKRNGENPVSGHLFFSFLSPLFFPLLPGAFNLESVEGNKEGDEGKKAG